MEPAPQRPGAPLRVIANDQRNGFRRLQDHMNSRIVGQPQLVERLLVALLADGHLLVEGPPGLAKTKAIRALSEAIEGSAQRIQFTPDLLPADLTGTEIYQPEDGSFRFAPGPVFHNLILADEINRAPAKVQSALLEAMAERQVTVGSTTHDLDELFLVMATQNPIEQEGTYPLPEAQLDRFLMHVRVGNPDTASERKILELVRKEAVRGAPRVVRPLSKQLVLQARTEALGVHLSPALEEYLIQLIMATRDPSPYGEDLARWVEWGASPRATIALDRCARARAWLQDRDYVTPEDIHALAHDVLRHRIVLGFEAEAEGVTSDDVLDELLVQVPLT